LAALVVPELWSQPGIAQNAVKGLFQIQPRFDRNGDAQVIAENLIH
jgi:hypothetical protein